MKIVAREIRPDLNFAEQHGVELLLLDGLLKRSDFVSLHLRLNPETEGLIGRRELGLMKSTAFLINTARAALVDEAALTEAILHNAITTRLRGRLWTIRLS